MTTITKERLQWLANISGRDDIDNIDGGEIRELARSVLASLDAEPAGYHVIKECGKVGCSVATLEEAEKTRDFWNKRWTIRPYFYSAAPAPIVPDAISTRQAISKMEECEPCDSINVAYKYGWNACRATMLQANQRDLSQPVDPQVADYEKTMLQAGNSPVSPGGWISCSERMPEDEQEVIVHNKLGYRYVSYFDEHSGLFFDMRGGNQMNCIEHILVTHWMPLPEPPEPDQN
ncbi:TPA: DUF551 domain-containing protein [Salmonella enterica subsp. enterica serovar Kottbus]|nr:DUF551 domain-containing protein [Salmonella enterica subsp. enterica serovar Kottbus]